ncbi:MAG TPA: 16S rRNA (cytosine(967)-C(5))-methyltransferase RsmB, partial [Desulfobacterales bacterium]|nr:16S rRNA (cytosine(967)-C(5))-methyltransferase RsmB [Desulfobacterales bacterium]
MPPRPSDASTLPPASDARRATVRVLCELDQGRRTLDAVMHALEPSGALRDDPRERDLMNALVFGVLRWRGRLDHVIGRFSNTPKTKIDPPVLNVLRTAVFQLAFMDRIPPSAAVNTAVEIAKSLPRPWAASFVNAVLRKAAAGHHGLPLPDPQREPVRALAVAGSLPEWIAARWVARHGYAAAAALCGDVNTQPSLTLRANTLKATRDDLARALAPDVASSTPAGFAPDGLTVEGLRPRIGEISAFRSGWFQVQDEAAQLVSLLLAPRPGDTVLDACAGRGGKTGHLAALMENQGAITALDLSRPRLAQLEAEMQRLGVGIASVCEADLNLWRPAPETAYDRVLLDAPCSGLGTLRRNPDIKWAAEMRDLARYHRIQSALLDRAANLTAAGGALVYAVCSPEPEETVDVVRGFLSQHPEFEIERGGAELPPAARSLVDAEGFLQTGSQLRYM